MLPLSPSLHTAVLDYLGIDPAAANAAGGSLDLLDRLVAAYTRCVPWESAFRIAKRVNTVRIEECPRWPDEFWQDAMARGGGGTCFESNYAFFALLRGLGYEGYLTINDMNEMCGCHTAIVLTLDGQRWLVDVGLPIYAPAPLDPAQPASRASQFHTYTTTPLGGDRYQITRDRHGNPYMFTLIDRPVADADYRAATTADYEASGHFLAEVIITKVIDDTIWRFNGRQQPPALESFGETATSQPLPASMAEVLSLHFGMDRETLRRALGAVGLLA